ncbi:MAG TPA: cellulose binding domain-containing protein [Polyangia bacterium]|nr:cellulose binding domain-containing protein [Polyangia bacterium]
MVGLWALSCAGGQTVTTGPTGTGGTGVAGTSGAAAGHAGTNGAAGTLGRAGTSGIAGTFGAAGTFGTAGTFSTGGTTGAGGGGAGCSACRIELLAECQGSSTSSTQIGVTVEIQNEALMDVDLSTITLRYYFTLAATATSPVLEIDTSQVVPSSDIVATFTSTYMQVGFTAAAGTLASAASTGQIQLRFHDQSYATFDSSPTTDYSYLACSATDAAASTFVPRANITAYIGGVLKSGTEPTQ